MYIFCIINKVVFSAQGRFNFSENNNYHLNLIFCSNFGSTSWFGVVCCNKSELESSDTNKHTNLSSNNNSVTTNIITTPSPPHNTPLQGTGWWVAGCYAIIWKNIASLL